MRCKGDAAVHTAFQTAGWHRAWSPDLSLQATLHNLMKSCGDFFSPFLHCSISPQILQFVCKNTSPRAAVGEKAPLSDLVLYVSLISLCLSPSSPSPQAPMGGGTLDNNNSNTNTQIKLGQHKKKEITGTVIWKWTVIAWHKISINSDAACCKEDTVTFSSSMFCFNISGYETLSHLV